MDLPRPDEARTYRIGLFLEVTIIGIPKCLWCEAPVLRPSMDGPLVCGPCDMGTNSDGTKWTDEQRKEKAANFKRRVTEYRDGPLS